MKEVNAINFLLYSYFELTLSNEKEEEILAAAIARAYRDASRRVLSITDETNTAKDENGEVMPLLDLATKCLKKQFNYLISDYNNLTSDYDTWFYNTCKELKGIYINAENNDGKPAFTFGHAQKWVNMTMKYLYVIKSIFEKYGTGTDIFPQLTPDFEKKLHIPVDNYIMQAVASTPKGFCCGLEIKLPNKNSDEKLGCYSSAKAWSKWGENDYMKFRDELFRKESEGSPLNKAGSPLDWENDTWIKIARIRKEKEKK